jgi:transcriptional regulator with XRE-family HTH domain
MAAGDLDNNDFVYNQEMFRKIGARLKVFRKARGYDNYEKFANAFNLNRTTYGKHERGVNLTMASLLKILSVLNVSLKEFFSEDLTDL